MLLVCGTWWSSCAWLNLQNRFDDVRNHNCFCEEIARLCLHVLLSVGKMLEEKNGRPQPKHNPIVTLGIVVLRKPYIAWRFTAIPFEF
jgi:hypothetical protein